MGAGPDARATFLALFDALPASASILDESGTIVAVNRAWREFGASNGLLTPNAAVGLNYLGVCGADSSSEALRPAAIVASTIRGILQGEFADCYVEYDCHGPAEKRWFIARVKPIQGVAGMRVLILHDNVTPLRQVQEQLRRSNAMLRRLLNRRRRPLSDEEVTSVEAACQTTREQLIVFTMLDIGLRVSELNRIALLDLDGTPGVRVSRDDEDGSDRERRLPLSPRTSALWRQFFSNSADFDLSTRQVQRIVQTIGKRAGVSERLTPQSLRETFAVRLIENGADSELLSYAMGYQQQFMPAEEAIPILVRLIGA